CEPGQFQCGDGSCIDYRRRCDGHYDCNDYSDEQNCECEPGQFQCGDGSCIDYRRRCDGHYDCNDYSDEQNCGMLK
ncbi:low-density lipoprotein receptor, putative, partial [Ixodes scapularis]